MNVARPETSRFRSREHVGVHDFARRRPVRRLKELLVSANAFRIGLLMP